MDGNVIDPFGRHVRFLADLEAESVFSTLSKHRPEIVTINMAIRGERWQIELESNNQLHLEASISRGHVGEEELLADFYERYIWPEVRRNQ
jgi:hypothetical protein